MERTRLFNADKVMDQDGKELYNAQLAVGLGKKAVGIAMDLQGAEMGSDLAVFTNEDFTITVTSKKAGAVGRVFFDLFEND